ncbi:terminase gpA endonuclease subunit [Paramagnetospirillum magneticum]|uniref:Bacteriophage tail assembly protein n=1 Tax=Paramagnetospirillum magneticum (strain ATCC 700264 / AMB-1) TaxID=342108 RepID=Q2W750_PARM1|nr:terminase gpA endonuclease subunit [Paramagnetospirillum magneticum]BAE50325.1 Bacteriophage tail assembly protein [Paramagnetospirillum magneticum AMB-1]
MSEGQRMGVRQAAKKLGLNASTISRYQGEPNSLIDKRDLSYRRSGYKRLYNSTPDKTVKDRDGKEVGCRTEAKWDESDQRRRYIRCPHCGAYQVLRWDNFRFNEVEPHGAYFLCADPTCGGVIDEGYHDEILAGAMTERTIQAMGDRAEEILADLIAGNELGAVWIKTYPGDDCPGPVIQPEDLPRALLRPRRGRVVGFAGWTAISMTVPFDDMAHEWVTSRGKPEKVKDFVRQVLGEPFQLRVNVPEAEKLLARRQSYRIGGVLPKGVLFLTMTIDVQGNRLEWAVYGWGIGLSSWLVDKGIIEGDTGDDIVWARLDGVIGRRYRDAAGRSWPVDAVGVDTGFRTQRVYRWVMAHATTGRVFALDGRDGWMLPALGTPSKKDVDFNGAKIGEVQLWPVGTWDLKADHYAALAKFANGPDAAGKWADGVVIYPDACDREYFEQLTAEYLREDFDQWGRPVSSWHRRSKGKPNEGLDLAVYGRALAHHLSDSLTADQWKALATARAADPKAAQTDIEEYARRLAEARAEASGEGVSEEASAFIEGEGGRPPANAIRSHDGGGFIDRDTKIYDRF